MERLTISLDTESARIINTHLAKYNGSKADVIRKALHYLQEIEEYETKTSIETLRIYIGYLANMEHVIVDIALWKAIFHEIQNGSDEFWDEVYRIGQEHQKEFYDRGIKEIKTILKYIERTNVFNLNIDSENSYTLILSVSEASKFLKTFFQGFFKNYSKNVEITEEYKKLRIRII